MKKLDIILQKWALGSGAPALGAPAMGNPKQSAQQRKRDILVADLRDISGRNEKLALVLVIALVLILLVNLWMVLFGDNLASAKTAIGLLGLSAVACVRWLYKLWTEKSATELLLRLAVDMEGDALDAAIKVLVKQALSHPSQQK